MTFDTKKVEETIQGLIVFDSGEAILKQQKMAFSNLDPIEGPDDALGLKVWKDAWLTLRGYRTKIEADRKIIKEPFLEACKKIDAEAKRLVAICEPLEKELAAEVHRVEGEILQRKRAKVTDRQDQFRAVGMILPDDVVEGMDDETFATQLEGAQLRHKAVEAQRMREAAEAEAAARRKAEEEERLAQERLALQAEREALRKEREALEAMKPKPPPEPAPKPAPDLEEERKPSQDPSATGPRPGRRYAHDCPFCKCPVV